MKAFFEEYGFILVAVVVMATLITLVSQNGAITSGIKDNATKMVEKLGTAGNDEIDKALGNADDNNE